jgi:hypothetical protein
MANTVFKLRRSSVAGKVPNTSTLAIGELGLNLTDKILYSSDGTNVFEIGSNNTIIRVTNTAFIANATVNSIAFTNAGITATSGVLTWNPDESTLDLGLAGNNSILKIGQETVYLVRNATGSTITKGTVVMANGTIGNSGRIKVTPAIANNSVPSHYIMGVATENITNGSDGYVAHFGKIRGINTTAWPDGSILYADPANTGGLTATKPTAPNHKTIVAIVIHSASNGILFVRPTFGSDLADDERVELTSIANGDMLVYRSATSRFENTKDLIVNSITANNTKGANGQVLASSGNGTYWFTPIGGVLPVQQQYTANGSTTSFIVTGGYVPNTISVFLNGVMLRNGIEVDVTSGSEFTISPAPANGSFIDVVGQSRLYSTGVNTIVSQQFTANGTANSFVVTGGYIANSVLVFLNGVKQIPGTDVDISSGANVGFYSTPSNGFIVDVYGYQTYVSLGANTITVGSNLTIGTDSINIGNSTVNTQITAGNIALNGSLLKIGNSTVNTSLDGGTLVLGSNTATFGNAVYFVANGNVGVGNATPAHKLSVGGSAYFTGTITSNAGTPIVAISNNSYTPQIQLYNTANDVSGAYFSCIKSRGSGASLNGDTLGTIAFTGSNSSGSGILSGYIAALQTGDTGTTVPMDMVFLTSNSSIGNQERLRIARDGNVGIGTSSPGARLQVVGASGAVQFRSGTANGYLEVNAFEAGTVFAVLGGTSLSGGSIGTQANVPLGLLANNTTHALLAANGNFGIGTTSPDGKLAVTGGRTILRPSNEPYALGLFYGTGSNPVYIGSPAANSFQISRAGGDAVFNIDGNGNTGIGNTTPAHKLSVSGNSFINGFLTLGSAGTPGFISYRSTGVSQFDVGLLGGDSDSTAFVYNRANGGLVFGANNAQRMAISAAGDVNIGTAAEAGNSLRYFDIQNANTGSSAGAIMRFITANAAGTGVTTVDIVKYKNGLFVINNNEPSGIFTLNNAGSERIRINSFGNVGIGNSSPSDRLVVAGNITPSTDNSHDLGSSSLRWANIYTGDLNLSNEGSGGNDVDGTTGSWTIQEGENDLYIINKKNGKKFKIKLEEIV